MLAASHKRARSTAVMLANAHPTRLCVGETCSMALMHAGTWSAGCVQVGGASPGCIMVPTTSYAGQWDLQLRL